MKTGQVALELVGVISGSFLFAAGINTLLTPSHLLAGGVTGACQILNYFFHWPVGAMFFIINIPLLMIGYFRVGKKFAIYTILSVAVSSAFFDLIPVRSFWTDNVMLASIFGSVVSGAGGALVLRAGGSSGGLDIVSRIVAKYSDLSIANIGLLISVAIVTISAFIYDVQSAMFTIISLFAGARTYDAILNHARKISVTIVSEKGEEISEALSRNLQRGVTIWEGIGTYTKKKRSVLHCVIVNLEWPVLCREVQRIDAGAFISAAYSQKIKGNFRSDW